MKIPKSLPQFEKSPALFIASGEYEAKFYMALDGNFELWKTIKMSPREEAREKQAFTGHKTGMRDLVSLSHHGSYIEDLKRKFQKKVHEVIHDLLAEFKLREIYVFAPRYVAKRIMDCLDKAEQKKVRMEFFQEDTKSNPLLMIRKFWDEEIRAVFRQPAPKNGAKKILAKPRIR